MRSCTLINLLFLSNIWVRPMPPYGIIDRPCRRKNRLPSGDLPQDPVSIQWFWTLKVNPIFVDKVYYVVVANLNPSYPQVLLVDYTMLHHIITNHNSIIHPIWYPWYHHRLVAFTKKNIHFLSCLSPVWMLLHGYIINPIRYASNKPCQNRVICSNIYIYIVCHLIFLVCISIICPYEIIWACLKMGCTHQNGGFTGNYIIIQWI